MASNHPLEVMAPLLVAQKGVDGDDTRTLPRTHEWTASIKRSGFAVVAFTTLLILCRGVPTPSTNTTMKAALDSAPPVPFPGMDDNTTKLECCAATILVDLERHYVENKTMPFSTLLFDQSKCGSYIESIENSPHCCSTPNPMDDDHDPFGSRMLPFWASNCILPSKGMGFMFYYDGCPANLLWDERSCDDWIQTQSKARIVRRNLSFVDGKFVNGMAVVFSTDYDDTNVTSVYVPDVVSNSCWQVDCSWDESISTDECIQFAQDNLQEVSLDVYVNTTKRIWCE